MENFSIKEMIVDAENQGIAFRELLENDMSKAILGIRQVMSEGDLGKVKTLVNVINCHLVNHPKLHGELIRQLGKAPHMLSVFESAGLRQPMFP